MASLFNTTCYRAYFATVDFEIATAILASKSLIY